MKLGNSFSDALRTFAYFIASGTHYQLEGVDYLELFGEEPSAIEQFDLLSVTFVAGDSMSEVF